MQRPALVGSLLAILVAGCSNPSTADLDRWRAEGQHFLLAEEPAGAQGVLDYREAESAAEEVVLVGRIGGGDPTWSAERAAFVIRDPAADLSDAHAPGCTSPNCPYCSRKKTGVDESLAVVLLTTADGRVPPVAARHLLPLAEGQTVVVRGRPEVNSLGQLLVHARGLYLRDHGGAE